MECRTFWFQEADHSGNDQAKKSYIYIISRVTTQVHTGRGATDAETVTIDRFPLPRTTRSLPTSRRRNTLLPSLDA